MKHVTDVRPRVAGGSRGWISALLSGCTKAVGDGAMNPHLPPDFLQLLEHCKARTELGFLRVVIISWGSENPSKNLMSWQLCKASEKITV